MKTCVQCGMEIGSESPIFYFPKFNEASELAKYAGPIHVSCIRNLNKTSNISAKLAEAYLAIFDAKSQTPIVARNGNLLVKNCLAHNGTYEVYDFEDFVTFYIQQTSIMQLKSLPEGGSISLGVQKLQMLHRREHGAIELEITRPHSLVDLPNVNFDRLLSCIASAEGAAA